MVAGAGGVQLERIRPRDGIFIPGNWDVGIRFKLPVIEETGQDFGISIRFRWYYDYRKLIAQDIPGLFAPRNKN